MHGRIVRQLRVKSGSEDTALPNKHRMARILREDLDARANGFDDGRTNEDHFKRLFAQTGGAEMNVTGELATVPIAQNGDVQQSERGLRRAVDFAGKKDGTGAGTEERATAGRKFPERVEQTFLGHHFEVGGAFAARKNDARKAGEIAGQADEGVADAEAVEHPGVRFVVSLNGDDSDFHFNTQRQGNHR